MRTSALCIALAGVVAANLAPAPAPTAAASLDTRAACDVDYELGRPLGPPAVLKPWLRTARPIDQCTDQMPASLTAVWMSYVGELSSFIAHAPEKTDALTDLCGSATYTVSMEFCTGQAKIVVTDEDSGETLTTIPNTVKDPGTVVLTSKNGKIGVADAPEATATAPTDGGDSEATSTATGKSSTVVKTSSKSSMPTTGADSTLGGASKTSSGAGSSETPKPKDNAAGKIGAGVAAVAAGVAAFAL